MEQTGAWQGRESGKGTWKMSRVGKEGGGDIPVLLRESGEESRGYPDPPTRKTSAMFNCRALYSPAGNRLTRCICTPA